jgi:signal transduction histidine kinase
VALASTRPERRYGPADLALAEDLAQRAALAIDNARLFRAAQQAIREAQGAAQARDAFLARASHELRTPLTSALGTIRLLERAMAGRLNESPEELIGIAGRNLSAMLALINDLLDASKLALGHEPLVLQSLDLATVIRASVEIVGVQAREKSLSLGADAPAGLRVRGDRLKLEQVFVNLLSNAVKFTSTGGQVTVEAAVEADAVVVRVRDTGRGIAPEHLERIFEPFFQISDRGPKAAADRRSRPRGTGLGLAISRQIVALHGGRVWAESEGLGKGATFVVRLPAAAAEG